MSIRQWKRTLAIGGVIALTSQLYWNAFIDYFRISTSVILLPVLLMTVGLELHTLTTCFVTSVIVFTVRFLIQSGSAGMAWQSTISVLRGAVLYLREG